MCKQVQTKIGTVAAPRAPVASGTRPARHTHARGTASPCQRPGHSASPGQRDRFAESPSGLPPARVAVASGDKHQSGPEASQS